MNSEQNKYKKEKHLQTATKMPEKQKPNFKSIQKIYPSKIFFQTEGKNIFKQIKIYHQQILTREIL